jgi:catechol 2,3-dioxygenase-like lactoylglutathione lyase family enzyme
MIQNAKYVHTNIVARDWRAQAKFYQDFFGAVPIPPERNISGKEVDALTGIDGAHVRGVHLKLPGFDANGPTLEIFQYEDLDDNGPAAINQPGFAHIAFSVDSVTDGRDEMLAHGATALGELVSLKTSDNAEVTLIYMRDPEGNIVELQRWS